nr:hypothetical protein [Halarchaeum acidiphilum]
MQHDCDSAVRFADPDKGIVAVEASNVEDGVCVVLHIRCDTGDAVSVLNPATQKFDADLMWCSLTDVAFPGADCEFLPEQFPTGRQDGKVGASANERLRQEILVNEPVDIEVITAVLQSTHRLKE